MYISIYIYINIYMYIYMVRRGPHPGRTLAPPPPACPVFINTDKYEPIILDNLLGAQDLRMLVYLVKYDSG